MTGDAAGPGEAAGTSAPPPGPRRRILFWSDAYYTPAGGTEGQILALIRGLPAGYEAELWITHGSEWLAQHPFPCPSTLAEARADCPIRGRWPSCARLRRELEAGRFDLIQTYMCDAGILGAARREAARRAGARRAARHGFLVHAEAPRRDAAHRRASRPASSRTARPSGG